MSNALEKPKSTPKQPKFDLYNVGHISMQWSDRREQAEHDAKKLFRQGLDWITGTEGRDAKIQEPLRKMAAAHGYRIHFWESVWVAVKRTIIIDKNSWKTYDVPVLAANASKTDKHGPRGFSIVSFKTLSGTIYVAAGHYLTDSRSPSSPNYDANRKMAKRLDEFAHQHAIDADLFFYGGDQNMHNRKQDSFFGGALTHCWDEVDRWPDTGHGPIDVIAHFSKDKRVSCMRARRYTDRQLFLHTDHLLITAVYRVQRPQRVNA